MWQAPTKRSGTIHGWQRKIPLIELSPAQLLLICLSKLNGKGAVWEQNCMLPLCKSSNKCLPYRTSVQYVDRSAAQAAVCVLTGILHSFIAVIQTPKWECTPCSMQSGKILPVLRNSQCGVYERTHVYNIYIYSVWNIFSIF